MSHHGREDEREDYEHAYRSTSTKLNSALVLIRDIAKNLKACPVSSCDHWLEVNGYDCEATRRAQRERRAVQLDTEIARLRAERESL